MIEAFDYFREINTASVILRLSLAMFLGGLLGLERGRKRRPAGFRTYMLVCLGATLTMLLGQYEHHMLSTLWAEAANALGVRTDVSRFGAQVINGIGFLGAGTVLVTGRQQVKGLTTAASLWASACMGLAIGAGFYECVVLVFLLIFAVNRLLPFVEDLVTARARNVNVYLEFESMDDVGRVIGSIKSLGADIYEVELDRGKESQMKRPSAFLFLRMHQRQLRTKLLADLSAMEGVYMIEEF